MVKYQNFDEALPVLSTWLQTQPHLPQIDLIFLKTFIDVCDGDLEKSKKLIDTQYSMRNSYSHIFIERDPFDEGSKIIMDSYYILTLPGHDANGHIINLSKINDPDPDKFLHTPSVKLFFMLNDARLANEDPNGLSNGEISLFDMAGFSLKHLARLNITTLRIFMKYVQEGISVKVKGVHIVNSPTFMDKIMSLVKPFLGAELLNMIHFHLPNSETLYEYVPKDILPFEYGGKCGTLQELREKQMKLLIDKKDFLTNEKYWKINESLRPANQQRPDEMEGNFRKLNFD